jgi:hypothetical protein
MALGLQGEKMNENENESALPRWYTRTQLGFVFLEAMPSTAKRWVTSGTPIVDVVVGTAGTVQAWIDARTAESPLLAIVIGQGPVHGAAVVRVDNGSAALRACAVLAALTRGNDRKRGTVGPLDADDLAAHDLAAILGPRGAEDLEAIIVRGHGRTFVEAAQAVAQRLHGRRVTNAVVLLTFSSNQDTLSDANTGMQLLFDKDDDDFDAVLGIRSAAVALRRPRIDVFAVVP